MKMYLLNSTIISQDGFYSCKKLDAEEFKKIVKENCSKIKCYIGYWRNLKLIEKLTGKRFNVNREILPPFENDDILLVMRLKYQKNVKPDTMQEELIADDFDFFYITYTTSK